MNQLSRLNEFLFYYHFKSPNLQYLLSYAYERYSKRLIEEYIKASKHPLPHEYICTHI